MKKEVQIQAAYEAPQLDVIEVVVEKGFATSESYPGSNPIFPGGFPGESPL